MLIAGIDGCKNGWVVFKAELSDGNEARICNTTVECVSEVADLFNRRPSFDCAAIDIPIGLINRARECDLEARKLLRKPRSSSVFPAPCREALLGKSYAEASHINQRMTTKRLTQQSWGIIPKIKEVDDFLKNSAQAGLFEVHPELCFWQMNNRKPMIYRKKKPEGHEERRKLISWSFPNIDEHLRARPSGVAIDDLLDAAAAAWTAIRYIRKEVQSVGSAAGDEFGLSMKIFY